MYIGTYMMICVISTTVEAWALNKYVNSILLCIIKKPTDYCTVNAYCSRPRGRVKTHYTPTYVFALKTDTSDLNKC